MTITNDQIKTLKTLGFKSKGKRRFSFSIVSYQTICINVMSDSFQLEVDGSRIYGTRLSFDDIIKVITILYPNEKR